LPYLVTVDGVFLSLRACRVYGNKKKGLPIGKSFLYMV